MGDVSNEIVSLQRQFLGSEGAILLKKQARFAGAVRCSLFISHCHNAVSLLFKIALFRILRLYAKVTI